MALAVIPTAVGAGVLTSPSYRLDPNVANNFGGQGSSTSYKLVDSGGEAAVGSGTSTSYKLTQGYVAQLEQAVQLTLSTGTVSIPSVVPGTSQNATIQSTVYTDAPGYDLAINQNNNLTHTDTTTTIAAIAAAIAAPALWVEGTTQGLGFTITSGTSVDIKWGTNPNYKYAAIPGAATTFHTKNGFSGGASDVTTMQFRLDTASSQKAGNYTNNVTFTATTKP